MVNEDRERDPTDHWVAHDGQPGATTPAVDTQRSGPPPLTARYAALELEGQDVVIYDRENTSAWLQASHAVDLPSSEASHG